jgi:hypothetical protein
MKRFVLAIALTGLMSMTVLAGEVPINGVVGNVPTDGATAPPSATVSSTASTSSTVLVTVILTVLGLR